MKVKSWFINFIYIVLFLILYFYLLWSKSISPTIYFKCKFVRDMCNYRWNHVVKNITRIFYLVEFSVCVYVYFIFLDTLWASWIYSLLSVTIFGTFWLLLLEIFPCSLSTFQCFNNVSVLPLDITSHFLDELFCFCFHAFFPPLCISV